MPPNNELHDADSIPSRQQISSLRFSQSVSMVDELEALVDVSSGMNMADSGSTQIRLSQPNNFNSPEISHHPDQNSRRRNYKPSDEVGRSEKDFALKIEE